MASSLTRDWHGLPVWGWGGLALAGGGLGFVYLRGRQHARGVTTAANAASSDLVMAGPGQSAGAASAYGTAAVPSPPIAVAAGFDEFSNELQNILGPISKPLPDYTSETQVGSGYQLPQGQSSIVGRDNATYSPIANASAASAAQGSGETIYYQPAQGVFAPVPSVAPPNWDNATQLFLRS